MNRFEFRHDKFLVLVAQLVANPKKRHLKSLALGRTASVASNARALIN